ncbi:MAG: serine/threonine protein kinase [Proteobacteria bacterium]|nr:serine/threonine protein kinase [Cystobacterineae bacterium]MCL2258278.1 serine/threonine protein kinase [Cystobacterineae bacterium]MCL2315377.1 serine/threonine protein kinase [Pseudomonadota bacterium]
MSFQPDEHTGHRLGRYELLCRMAVGGMAEIFLGFAREGFWAGRAVVLKRMLIEREDDKEMLELVLEEAKLMAGLNHPNAVRVLDLEVTDTSVCLVIEFIPGLNLEELTECFQGPLPLGLTLAVVRGAALGLNHAHNYCGKGGQAAPIIHRDVTPRNIILSFDGRSRVLDFGIARIVGAQRRTTAGMVRGTSAYMSPEQATDQPLDIRTDIFSLGVVFHELLSGERLFSRGKPMQDMMAVFQGAISLPSQANRKLPRSIDNLVLRMLERSLDKRFQTMGGFIEELDRDFATIVWTEAECLQFTQKHFSKRRNDIESMLSRIDVFLKPSPAVGHLPFEEAQTVIERRSAKNQAPQLLSFQVAKEAPLSLKALPPSSPRAALSSLKDDEDVTALIDSHGKPLVFLSKVGEVEGGLSKEEVFAVQTADLLVPKEAKGIVAQRREKEADTEFRSDAVATDELLEFPESRSSFSIRWFFLGIVLIGLALGMGWWLGKSSIEAQPPPHETQSVDPPSLPTPN